MQQLKTRYLTLCFLIALTGFSNCHLKEQKPPKEPSLELMAQLGGSGRFMDSIGVVYIAVTLYNPTADTISFASMSCSYEDFFTTDTKEFTVQSRYDCYKNGPSVVDLPPGKKTDRFIMITKTGKGDTEKQIRIGMYYSALKKGTDFNDRINIYEHRQNVEVIWSNQLDLKRFRQIIY